MRVRRALVLLSIAILATLVCIGILEFAVRVAGIAPDLPVADNVTDPYLPHKPLPGSVSTSPSESREFAFERRHNGLGFRDVEHVEKKPAGVFRIVALGDSFTYGSGAAFDDTYLVQLERRFNERPRPAKRIEIIKMGLPRYFPLLEHDVLFYYGLRFEPDLVLVAILPNDVLDTYLGVEAVSVDSGFLLSKQAMSLGPWALRLYQQSHLVRIALRSLVARQAQMEKPLHVDEVYKDDGFHEPAWRAVEASLDDIRQTARANGAGLAVIALPQHGPWNSASAYPESRLKRWSETRGVAFVPTLAAVQRGAAAGPLYWQRDGHCNAAGYAVIADTIFTELIRQGAVP